MANESRRNLVNMQNTREVFPDFLRGFALLGIVLVNAPFLGLSTVLGVIAADVSQAQNYVPALLINALALGKFYLLFSFLFGYSAGFVLKDSKDNLKRWIARAFFLIVMGALHASFLFHGDILFGYGVLALVLALLYFRSDRVLKIWARVLYLGTTALFTAFALLLWFAESILGEDVGETVTESRLDYSLVSGSFLDNASARIELLSTGLGESFLLQGLMALSAFLVGVLASRRRLLAAGASPEAMKKLALWGLGLGLPIQLTGSWFLLQNQLSENFSSGVDLGLFVLLFFSAPLLSAGYVGGLWLVLQTLGRGVGLIAAAGRHSLSVYISQSLILAFVFSNWGLGLFGQLQLWLVTLIAIAAWLVPSLLALWNSRYRASGPLEWLLKKTTAPFRSQQ